MYCDRSVLRAVALPASSPNRKKSATASDGESQ